MLSKWRRKRKQSTYDDKVAIRFQAVIDLIKDLDKKEFNRLKEGMDLAWQAYNKVAQAKPSDEKEVEDIDNMEKMLRDV